MSEEVHVYGVPLKKTEPEVEKEDAVIEKRNYGKKETTVKKKSVKRS